MAQPLVPLTGAVTADSLVEPLRRLLTHGWARERLARAARRSRCGSRSLPEAVRTPFFCSGCPHNTGTKVPEGALVGAGIGCHGMVTLMGAAGRGEIIGITQMGGEGAQWIGIAPFVDDQHLFQNLGDGTYCHSGQLAIQAAIAAGVTMTFKLLYNAAVAMTGGQDAAGLLPVPQLAAKLMAGRRAAGHHHHGRAGHVPRRRAARAESTSWHRDRIIEAQEQLRTIDRRHRAHPRPAMRGREAAGPQARPAPDAGAPDHDRRAGLRGVRRLRRAVELPQPARRRAPSSAARP